MANQSPTYSIKISKACSVGQRSGYLLVRRKLKRGTYKIPGDLTHIQAAELLHDGSATKISTSFEVPETKAAISDS